MLAIIGGSGLNELGTFQLLSDEKVATCYSAESVTVSRGQINGRDVCFLPRHGKGHTVPPHHINYRANIKALQLSGVQSIIAVNAVGGLDAAMGPGVIVIPDQIIDYTWGREHTFYTDTSAAVTHVDFTNPYDENLRQLLLDSARKKQTAVLSRGVYGCTQGPRLETSAEIRRLRSDGCDMVGMTGMPEAALARELEIPYACIALSVNWAAGISDELITMAAINKVLDGGMGTIKSILQQAVRDWR